MVARKVTKEGAEKPLRKDVIALVRKGKKSSFPSSISPMLATLHNEPFDGSDWLFEIKWDGYRAIAMINEGTLSLTSRKHISLKKFHPIAEALEELKIKAVLDGEIVVLNKQGHSDFQMLQTWEREKEGHICYKVFDVLWYDGYDLRGLPLIERKQILKQILPVNDTIQYCDHVIENGKKFFELVVKRGIEGIIAKKSDSSYQTGVRSKSWLKVKNVKMMGAVIAGFTKGRGSRKHFGALLLGTFKNNQLVYIGHTGSGMDEKTVKELFDKMKPLITKECPFKEIPMTNMPATWIKPKLICEVKYQEVTRNGLLRLPIFLGVRKDKSLAEIKKESIFMEEISS